jgi:hypothetical protein
MSIEQLVTNEPWRTGVGQPKNALDPTWTIERSIHCDGEQTFEHGTNWWWCEKCGYCSKSATPFHLPINNPHDFLEESIHEYIRARSAEGVSDDLAMDQIAHIAGMAVRYASTIKSINLKSYLEQLRAK